MALLSFAAYARHRQVDPAAVTRAVQKGRITATKDPATGRRAIDPVTADAEWEANSDASKLAGAREAKRRAASPTPPPDPGEEPEGADDDASGPPGGVSAAVSYSLSRARREHYQAGLARLNYEQKHGSLVVAVDVRRQAFAAAHIVREGILNIPDRLAAQLAGESDPRKVHELLTAELGRVLEELANGV